MVWVGELGRNTYVHSTYERITYMHTYIRMIHTYIYTYIYICIYM